MKKYDVTAIGELLIDFGEEGTGIMGNPVYEANPGGAPCNMLAMLAKLGRKTAFIGKVGNDNFGRQLTEAVKKCGIATEGLVYDNELPTTLAFVHNKPDGDREFTFCRTLSADMSLKAKEVKTSIIEESRIFHFGTLSMTHPDVKGATEYAITTAKNAGAIISFDPNLRMNLWNSEDAFKAAAKYGFSQCNILKISDNELEYLTGRDDMLKGAHILQDEYNIPLIFVTLGKKGAMVLCGNAVAEAPTYPAKTIDTTGAGDTFMGAALNGILELGCNIENISAGELKEVIQFANAAASLITERKGALAVMPTKEEIEKLRAANPM